MKNIPIKPSAIKTEMSDVHCNVYAPHPRLGPHIRCYFHIRVTGVGFHFPTDGCPGLIVNLKDPFLLGFHEKEARPFAECRLFGASTRQMHTHHQTGQTEPLADITWIFRTESRIGSFLDFE